MVMIKFKFLTGDMNWLKYGGKWISQKCNNGEFDYWLVLELINMHEATGKEEQDKYHVSIQAVSPELIDSEKINGLLADYNIEQDKIDDELKVMALSEHGTAAHLWYSEGNNYKQLFKLAHNEAQLIDILFGLYMDKQENKIGMTGWDFIKGRDIKEYLNSVK